MPVLIQVRRSSLIPGNVGNVVAAVDVRLNVQRRLHPWIGEAALYFKVNGVNPPAVLAHQFGIEFPLLWCPRLRRLPYLDQREVVGFIGWVSFPDAGRFVWSPAVSLGECVFDGRNSWAQCGEYLRHPSL